MVAGAVDPGPIQSKRKAITALLPYAVWRERGGQPEMLDTVLHAARASRMSGFMWYHVDGSVSALLAGASPSVIAPVLSHITCSLFIGEEGLIQRWAGIASAVRALKDVEALKSFLLPVWSEWNVVASGDGMANTHPLDPSRVDHCGFCVMRTSIQEDFGGTGMTHHRAGLIHRLDHVLAQLDRGLEHFKQYDPKTNAHDLQGRKEQYGVLRETLLETNAKAIGRLSHLFNDDASLRTDSGRTQDLAQRLCAHCHFHVCSFTTGTLDAPAPRFVRRRAIFCIVPVLTDGNCLSVVVFAHRPTAKNEPLWGFHYNTRLRIFGE